MRNRSAVMPGARALLVAATAALLVGCAVGPDYHRPPVALPERYLPELPAATVAADGTSGAAQQFLAGRDPDARWWHAFNVPAIDLLVEEALKANPSIAAAQGTLRSAQELVAAQKGAFWPQLQLSADASRQRNAVEVLSPTLTSGQAIFNLYTPQLTVGFMPDVFGANRRAVESLEAQALVAKAGLDATYLTLVANVVTTAFEAAGYRAQVEATEHVVAVEREVLSILKRSEGLGALSAADVANQTAQLAQLEATLPALKHQLEVARHALAVLLGRFPTDTVDVMLDLDAVAPPSPLPLSVPSRLLERRPDLVAAEAQLHAATAQVGVAIGNLLPQVTISAGVGSSATQVSDLFRTGSTFWSIGANLSQTLFAGGALVHRKRAAVAAMDAAGAQYRLAVLTAFQNVADALHAVVSDAESLAAQQAAMQASEVALNAARTQLKLGAINFLALSQAEQSYQQARVARVQAQLNRLADSVALIQAMGGAIPPPP
jgi:NodT family efflux transporter outer membrane factor (OMF) lipoprotein